MKGNALVWFIIIFCILIGFLTVISYLTIQNINSFEIEVEELPSNNFSFPYEEFNSNFPHLISKEDVKKEVEEYGRG